MTPDDLEALVLDPKGYWPLQQALAPLAENERARLSTHARKLHDQLTRKKLGENASDRLKAYFRTHRPGEGWHHVWDAESNRCATLALFGLCPVSALKKRGIFVFHQEQPIFERIIEDRRPVWLDDWVAYSLDDEFPHLSFPTLRRWIKNGLCRKPEVDGYYQLFAGHLMRTSRHNSDEIVPPLSRQLLDDRDMLEDVDALFRVETIAFNTNSWLVTGARVNYETWPDALVKLSGEGHLDRGHLLARALGGLRLDLKQNQLSGYHGLYRRLSPTADERLRHQADYIALLCHPVGHVVKFALEMLGGIDKVGALETAAVLGEMPLVLAGESKGNATAALKLIGRIVSHKDAFEGLALDTVGEALRHASADVQGQALTLLEKHAARLTRVQLEKLGALEAFVAASNRQRLSVLSSARQSDAAPMPAPIRAVSRDDGPYHVLSADINDHKVLFAEDRIVPIASVNELIDALFHAVEVVESPDEVDRIIDAVVRFPNDRSADFTARIAPLLHRLRSQPGNNKGLVVAAVGINGALWDLLATWISGERVNTARKPASHETVTEGFVPLRVHLGELAQRVAEGRVYVRLSAPTHKGGWIDPLTWVERLRQTSGNDVVASMDLRLSLLRLAPDNRGAALAGLDGLSDALRRIATFALGGDEMPGKADRGAYAAWISAARCRAPYKDWRAEFAALNLADAWSDALAPANYGWQAGHTKHRTQDHSWKLPKFDITTNGLSAEAIEASGRFLAGLAKAVSHPLTTSWEALPSAALVQGIDQDRHWYTQYELNAAWLTQWLAYVWPQNPSAIYMKAAKGLAANMDEGGSTWGPRFGFFYALFQKGRPWRESGHLLLCLGLAARDADVKGLAVDALIEGIDGQLFDPDLFAATLARVAQGEWLKLNRLGESLMTVLQVSTRHADVVGDTLQKWLPKFDHRQTGGFVILEVLLEVQALTGAPLTSDAKACLSAIVGSSKVAKVAQQLLKRDATSSQR